MVSFDGFNLTDGSPIYLQIIRHIERGVVSGIIGDGDELPSRRVLSTLLGVNPNTVQKAYRQLEDDGLIASRSGARSFMQLDAGRVSRIRDSLLRDELQRTIAAMRSMGVSLGETIALIETYWEEEQT